MGRRGGSFSPALAYGAALLVALSLAACEKRPLSERDAGPGGRAGALGPGGAGGPAAGVGDAAGQGGAAAGANGSCAAVAGAGGGISSAQCTDGIDNDGDGKVDYDDPECIGGYDNDEGSFAWGIPGDNNTDACRTDCFFDTNSGSGD